jgi:hypothetical protein
MIRLDRASQEDSVVDLNRIAGKVMDSILVASALLDFVQTP